MTVRSLGALRYSLLCLLLVEIRRTFHALHIDINGVCTFHDGKVVECSFLVQSAYTNAGSRRSLSARSAHTLARSVPLASVKNLVPLIQSHRLVLVLLSVLLLLLPLFCRSLQENPSTLRR